MKKLKLNLQQLEGAEVLTRIQLKNVTGGSGPGTPGGSNGNPCPQNCTRYCHVESGYMPAYGTCPPSVGGTSCHNYCCEGSNQGNYYWC
ncbi:hypothetical protein MKQ68_11540 [Chitinophaga horti]|uniref:Natural product n=1 Tax=Chitinophaga horti TaxID=2920382 RepID=A0ABY6J7R4_9BACT|nr:hypothetical protein [Chitinophaga horti]UYQ95735.1 hypothetical protein MKQ68_11540 [Chitinophaga horti]